MQKISNGAVVLGSVPEDGKVSIVAAFSSEVNKKGLQAGKFVGNQLKFAVVAVVEDPTSHKLGDAMQVNYQTRWDKRKVI